MSDSSPAAAIDGIWQMVRAELSGDEAPELVAQRTTLELSSGKYSVRFDGSIVDHGTFEISADSSIKSLRLSGISGPNAGRVIRGIYQRVRDRLRICYGLDGIQPSDFATSTGQNRYLATYRRMGDS